MESLVEDSVVARVEIIDAVAKSYDDTSETVQINFNKKKKHVKQIIIIIFYILFVCNDIVIRIFYYLLLLQKTLIKTSVNTKRYITMLLF